MPSEWNWFYMYKNFKSRQHLQHQCNAAMSVNEADFTCIPILNQSSICSISIMLHAQWMKLTRFSQAVKNCCSLYFIQEVSVSIFIYQIIINFQFCSLNSILFPDSKVHNAVTVSLFIFLSSICNLNWLFMGNQHQTLIYLSCQWNKSQNIEVIRSSRCWYFIIDWKPAF